jgi:hypothetical protein
MSTPKAKTQPKVRSRSTMAPKPQFREVTAVATFANPWEGDEAGEIEAIRAGKWHPSSVDFSAVANAPNAGSKVPLTEVYDVENIGRLAGALAYTMRNGQQQVRPHGEVKRFNLISHGAPGLIALSGRLTRDGACYLGDRHKEQDGEPGKRTQIDEAALLWLSGEEIENDGDGRGKKTLDAARAAFAKDGAELWLILCRAAGGVASEVGEGTNLARRLRDVFKVTVVAFSTEVWYWPLDELPANVKHPRIPSRDWTSIGEHGEHGRGYLSYVEAYYQHHGEKRRLGWHMESAKKVFEYPAAKVAPAKK